MASKKKKKAKSTRKKKRKIAITVGEPNKIWSNGLHQNAVFLGRLLKRSGYNVTLICHDMKDEVNEKKLGGVKLKTFKNISQEILNYDVVVCCSVSITDQAYEVAKKSGIKVVVTEYGNLYQIFLESALNKGSPGFGVDGKKYEKADALWASPHFERNKHWYKSFTDQEFLICPYIWEPLFFDEKCKEFDGDPRWSPEKNVKKIAIHEPNINIIKNCIVPLSIAAIANKRDPELIEKVYSLNTDKMKENKAFIEYVESINMVEKGSFDSRRSTPFMVCTGVMGTSVLHHTFNGLNYLTLEMLRLGYPVVHNSEEMKDAGYFYSGINSEEGADQLELAINTHADNFEIKQKQADEVVWKYSPENPKNTQGYKDLVESLFD